MVDTNEIKGVDSYSEKGKKGILLVMDNATIHHEKEVNRLLRNYNVLFLPPYSPQLNPIELWFYCLKKKADISFYKTPL